MAGEWIAILAVLTFVGSNVIFRRTEKEASPTFINFIRTAIGTITFFLLCGVYEYIYRQYQLYATYLGKEFYWYWYKVQ